jgi:four helix bundle protein
MYGITSQIRRAASSIPANIAEGCGRNGVPELARFLSIAMGSASELEYHIMLAHDLDLLSSEAYVQLSSKADEVKRMLGSYIEKMDADLRNHKSSTKNPKLESKEQGQQTTVSITS